MPYGHTAIRVQRWLTPLPTYPYYLNSRVFTLRPRSDEIEAPAGMKAPTTPRPTVRVVIVPGNGCDDLIGANWYLWMAERLRCEGRFAEVVAEVMPDPHKARRKVRPRWLIVQRRWSCESSAARLRCGCPSCSARSRWMSAPSSSATALAPSPRCGCSRTSACTAPCSRRPAVWTES